MPNGIIRAIDVMIGRKRKVYTDYVDECKGCVSARATRCECTRACHRDRPNLRAPALHDRRPERELEVRGG
eukprot:3372939-Heterocapsa_arctica.AAC.1